MANTKRERMEDVSVAYVQALCAKNGYILERVGRDNDSVDVRISCTALPADDCLAYSPMLNVQLKATYGNFKQLNTGDYSFALPVKNYSDLIKVNRMIPIILVVLHMSEDENDWVIHHNDRLEIKKCAYWVSLKGKEPSDNGGTVNVRIPQNNILSCDKLKEIMTKIAKGEEL